MSFGLSAFFSDLALPFSKSKGKGKGIAYVYPTMALTEKIKENIKPFFLFYRLNATFLRKLKEK